MRLMGLTLAGLLVLGTAAALQAADPPERPDAATTGEVDDGEEPTPEEMESFREALALLDRSTDAQGMLRAMEVLRAGFPASRGVLHRCVDKGSIKAKTFALNALGEEGDVSKDLDICAKALDEPDKRVRLAGIMAIRRLGTLGREGLAPLREHLPRETDENNLKMMIKIFQFLKDEEAVHPLVRVLKRQKDQGVRNFTVYALEVITDQKFGDDTEAWENYAEFLRLQEQAKKLIQARKLEEKGGA